jgi:tetratricopeptide (TPR) repeat protein
MEKNSRTFPQKCPWAFALIPRTIALFILLWQIRLLASELADTAVFAGILLCALGAALVLFAKDIKPVPALLCFILVPWLSRFFIALPRYFARDFGMITVFDALLLNLDRNNFAALLPFYWTAFASYFSLRSRRFLRSDIIVSDVFYLVLFCITPSSGIEAYRWPVLMIGLFTLVFFLQVLAFILSIEPEMRLRKSEALAGAAVFFVLVVFGGMFFIRPSQEKASERAGGLLEPKLFRFDFSQILRLDSEISVSDDLVLIVKKDREDDHLLLRRYTLSGYEKARGFFRTEAVDEKAHPQRLPESRTLLANRDQIKNYRETWQEYYLVNFDASAFIGMNMPVEVVPFETWDASSFNSAYAVRSLASEALPFELIDAVQGPELPGAGKLGLSEDEYRLYTGFGNDRDIAAFAWEIAGSGESYFEKIFLVYNRLKYGEYRYSLKPGIAADGDQLKYFLFDVKKGYCSYFAFAFALMLRSMGIPCRVAAGFFIDPETGVFDYYPVRSDMAHAWVEVWFPGYGWIEFDPTANALAEGEEFRFSQGTPPELFERLMKEILDNYSKLRPKEGAAGESGGKRLAELGRETMRFFMNWGPYIIFIIIIFVFIFIRVGFFWIYCVVSGPRRKARFLWAHVKRRSALAGVSKPLSIGEAEWAAAADERFNGIYALYLDSAAARFAQNYSAPDMIRMKENYRSFSRSYSASVLRLRRVLGWLSPPIALLLRRKSLSAFKILLVLPLLFFFAGSSGRAQENSFGPDILYGSAMEALTGENWERAVEFLSQGQRVFPNDIRFPRTLGNLYYQRRLFRLAWDEYQKANLLFPEDTGILFQLSRTAAYLNEDAVSASFLEKLLSIDADNTEAVGNLAWMYYKIHRLSDGEELLLKAMERMGSDSDFAMTLGTIYSDMFKYPEAKFWYKAAIEGAESSGDRLFAAVAHYNLSILESRFYQFDLAYTSTNSSLEAFDRASGRLARGELYMRRLALSGALEEYQEAFNMDTSPLSKLNLAQVYQIGGRLEEARVYAEDCLKSGDLSWMLNYGIDPVRYKCDIHEILMDTYRGLKNAEAFAVPGSPAERLRSFFRSLSFGFKEKVHRRLFSKYSLLAAEAYGKSGGESGETHPDALTHYYNAFKVYPRRGLFYLQMAKNYEKALIPKAGPSYTLEEGILLHKRELAAGSLEGFNPLWERDMIAGAFVELAKSGPGRERRDAAERLFALNRGALRQNGIRLPALLRITGAGSKTERTLRKAARSACIEDTPGPGNRYVLSFEARNGDEKILCTLFDNVRGITVFRDDIALPSLSGKDRTDFARTLGNGIFNAF